MKTICFGFDDFAADFDPNNNDFAYALQKHFDAKIGGTKPDYIFYSNFGYLHTKYDCVKIFFTGECVTPNFDLCDYAIGFDNIRFGDRYFRFPLYKLFQYRKDLERAVELDRSSIKKEGFCSFVVSNDSGMAERKRMFELLNTYKSVASGGRYLNNVGGPVKDKIEFQSHYKFCLCFENSSHPGYTTEKIVQAFASGAVPIYYGNPEIAQEFNPKAFINCHDFDSLEDALKRVIEIDNDEALYTQMLKEPISHDDLLDNSALENFLLHIFSQDPKQARRRPYNSQVAEEERKERMYARKYRWQILPMRRVRRFFKRIKNKSL